LLNPSNWARDEKRSLSHVTICAVRRVLGEPGPNGLEVAAERE
jgi:hypothetical protein